MDEKNRLIFDVHLYIVYWHTVLKLVYGVIQ